MDPKHIPWTPGADNVHTHRARDPLTAEIDWEGPPPPPPPVPQEVEALLEAFPPLVQERLRADDHALLRGENAGADGRIEVSRVRDLARLLQAAPSSGLGANEQATVLSRFPARFLPCLVPGADPPRFDPELLGATLDEILAEHARAQPQASQQQQQQVPQHPPPLFPQGAAANPVAHVAAAAAAAAVAVAIYNAPPRGARAPFTITGLPYQSLYHPPPHMMTGGRASPVLPAPMQISPQGPGPRGPPSPSSPIVGMGGPRGPMGCGGGWRGRGGRVCSFFRSPGGCHFGKNCYNLHV